MTAGIIGLAVDPGAPEDAHPSSGQDANGVGMVAAPGPGPHVDIGGPGARVARVVGEACDRGAQALVAGPPPSDAPGLAALVSDGSNAGLGGELPFGLEALAHVAELGEDLGGADPACAREGHDDRAVGQVGDLVLDAAGQPGD